MSQAEYKHSEVIRHSEEHKFSEPRKYSPVLESLLRVGISATALVLVASEWSMALLLGLLFPAEPAPLYPLARPGALLADHMMLCLGASLAAGVIGFVGGSFAYFRKGGFKELILKLGAFAQTVPPVAVLALLVPVMGFGNPPVLVALGLYGILPVIHGTLAGLESVPADIVDAARGLGMGRMVRFVKVELPLAIPSVLAGLRTSVVVNVGTAAIGAAMGAGGLGRPIMAGLVQFKTSYMVQGALAAAVLALALDALLRLLETWLTRTSSFRTGS
ncbi:MAG: ABC transporter permease [Spirochaetota bacterium]